MAVSFKEVHGKYTSVVHIISGSISVGQIEYDGVNGSRSGAPYLWHLSLPGNPRKGASVSREAAKVDLAAAFNDWLRAANLKD